MERLVIDSSVAVKWVIDEPYSSEALRVLDGYQNGDLALLAPDLIYAEVGNVVWKKQMFQGLSEAGAAAAIEAFRDVSFEITSSADLLDDAYRLAVAHQRSVYDSVYLALGAREGCRLITADEKLLNAVGAAINDLVWVGDWP
jgi:predicted nucleic acid-binding protein